MKSEISIIVFFITLIKLAKPYQRIVGGVEATRGSFPFISRLSICDGGCSLCGGSLIDTNWILTAAHCVTKNARTLPASGITVTLGEHDTQLDEGSEQRLKVSEVFVHSSYTTTSNGVERNDIAMLKLATAAQINNNVKTIALTDTEPVANTPCNAAGWGHTSSGGSSPDSLRVNYQILVCFMNFMY